MSEQGLLSDENLALLTKVREHLRVRLGVISVAFITGLVIGIPASAEMIRWLLTDANLLPSGVNVITLTPVEFIMLQVKVGAWLGFLLAIFVIAVEGAWRSQLSAKIPHPGRAAIITGCSIIALAAGGSWYAFDLLTPMLLDYLSADAQAVGLNTEWRLNGYVGFILNLSVACAIGFQAPVATFLAIESGAFTRQQFSEYRRHIWFTTFVIGAALSPPDPLSLFLVALPIIVLFELSLFLDLFRPKQRV
jgi:sec-independent protein translocase protein TatC